MSIEENKAKARRFIASAVQGTMLGDMLADNFIFWNAMTGELSRQIVLGMPGALGKAFKGGELRMTETGITAEGNRVAFEARSEGEFVDGAPYSNVYHFLVEFDADGKITRMNEHLDTSRAGQLIKYLGLPE